MAIQELVVIRDEFSVLVLTDPEGSGYECWNVNGGRIETPVGSTVYVEYMGVGNPHTDGKTEQYWQIHPSRPDYPGEWATFAGFFWTLGDVDALIAQRRENANARRRHDEVA